MVAERRTQQDYEELLIRILEDKQSITIDEFLDFLDKRYQSQNDQQIIRNIVSNRANSTSPFQKGILHYNEENGLITLVRQGGSQ